MIVQLGSLLTKRAAYTAGKVIVSNIQAFVGRRYSSDKKIFPSLALHIDEAQSVLYEGIEELFAKAGGAGVYIHGYCQSVSQLYAEIGQDRANTILDNCNSKDALHNNMINFYGIECVVPLAMKVIFVDA